MVLEVSTIGTGASCPKCGCEFDVTGNSLEGNRWEDEEVYCPHDKTLMGHVQCEQAMPSVELRKKSKTCKWPSS